MELIDYSENLNVSDLARIWYHKLIQYISNTFFKLMCIFHKLTGKKNCLDTTIFLINENSYNAFADTELGGYTHSPRFLIRKRKTNHIQKIIISIILY